MPLGRLRKRVGQLKKATLASCTCGWMNDEIALYLYSMIILYRPEVVIQTGHLWGKSALVILEALSNMGDTVLESADNINLGRGDREFTAFVDKHSPLVTEKPVLVSIDYEMHGVGKPKDGIELLHSWYPESFIFYREKSVDVFRQGLLAQFAGKRIFGVVDADHSEEGCHNDIQQLVDLKAECIFVDDTKWLPKLTDVVNSLANGDYNIGHMPWYNGVSVLQSKSIGEIKNG